MRDTGCTRIPTIFLRGNPFWYLFKAYVLRASQVPTGHGAREHVVSQEGTNTLIILCDQRVSREERGYGILCSDHAGVAFTSTENEVFWSLGAPWVGDVVQPPEMKRISMEPLRSTASFIELANQGKSYLGVSRRLISYGLVSPHQLRQLTHMSVKHNKMIVECPTSVALAFMTVN